MKINAEDIAFWIFTLSALGVILWLLHGSPTLENALISIGVLIISSEFMLWKKYFEVDKKTALGFAQVKSDLDGIKKDLNYGQQDLKDHLLRIEHSLKKGK